MNRILVLVCAGCMAVMACGGGQTTNTAKRGGTVTVALPSSLESYDPAMYRARQTEAVLANIFDELVVRTPDGKLVPDLAVSWKQVDGTHWTFTLRKGVKFQNGDPLTPDDVKFTLDRITQNGQIDGRTSSRQSLLPAMDPATVVDAQTVALALKAPSPPDILLAGLAHIQVVPMRLVKSQGNAAFAQHPVGSGPFTFSSGAVDGQTVLKRFADYWGGPPELGAPGPAKLDTVVFQVTPELSSALAALTSGSVQVVQGVGPDQVSNLRNNPSLQVKAYQDTSTVWFAMNTQSPPFDDVKVRQAMNHAINVDSIIKNLYQGNAVRMTGPTPPFSAFFDSSLKAYAYDPARARQLLAASGHPDGFTVVLDTTATYKDAAQAAAQDLAAVNVKATVRIWDQTALRAAALAGQRQLALMSWGNSFRHPFDLANPTLGTKQRGNFALYSNPELDSLLAHAANATDSAVAGADYKKAQSIVYQDAPWVFGWAPKAIEAASANLVAWNPGPDGMEPLVHVSLK